MPGIKTKIKNILKIRSRLKSFEHLFDASKKYYNLGLNFENSRNWQSAIIYYKKATELCPTKALWHYRLGFVYEKNENYIDSAKEYQAAIKLRRSSALWHYRLGFVQEKNRNWKEAIFSYESALKLNPSKSTWRYRLGFAYEKDKNYVDSVKNYKIAVSLNPSNAKWQYQLSNVQYKCKNWLGASCSIKSALELDKGNQKWFEMLGLTSEKILDWNTARYAFRRSYNLSLKASQMPGSPRPHLTSEELSRHIKLSSIYKPVYAYCVNKAAELASKLNIDQISVIEFGVAGGNGLVALENYADIVSRNTGIKINVYGFDTGGGLFAPLDYRDMPYFFAEGNYSMDVEALKNRLTNAKLILGDAAITFKEFLLNIQAPIGAISFDMDYYSATASVLQLIGDSSNTNLFLPRVSLYFDDVVGKVEQDYNEFTGELLAIKEFNECNKNIKIAEDRYFRSLPLNFAWHHSTYTMHRFDNQKYNSFVSDHTPETLSLKKA